MKETRPIWIMLKFSGIFLIILCLTACDKTEYALLDPGTVGGWTQYKSGTSKIPGNLVWDIELYKDNLWVSFLGKGVGVYTKGTWTFYNESNSDILNNYITDLEITPSGDVLMGTPDGICMRTAAGAWIYYQDESVTAMDINEVKYTSAGDIWIGTDGEGFYVDFGDGFQHYKFSGFENVNALEEDSKGHIWVGTDNGLLMYDGSSISLVFNTTNGLPSDAVTALFLDKQNNLWVGTDGGVTVSWINTAGKINQLNLRNSSAGNYIMDIYQDRKGDLWFATWFDGLIRYDGHEDNSGNIWIGLWSQGLIKYELPLE
ncbi:MAG: hypothetical protein MUF36_02880 [Bacteroidales bacterium]|nr:hypothetical protein [Bacteroidales bacterium]